MQAASQAQTFGMVPRLKDALADPALAAAAAAIIVTTAAGKVVFWNAAATRLYGWPAEEALGKSIMALTPALQARDDAEGIMHALRSGESWEGEIVLRRRDGTPFTAFVFDTPLERGEYIVGVSATTKMRAVVTSTKPLIAALIKRLTRT